MALPGVPREFAGSAKEILTGISGNVPKSWDHTEVEDCASLGHVVPDKQFVLAAEGQEPNPVSFLNLQDALVNATMLLAFSWFDELVTIESTVGPKVDLAVLFEDALEAMNWIVVEGLKLLLCDCSRIAVNDELGYISYRQRDRGR